VQLRVGVQFFLLAVQPFTQPLWVITLHEPELPKTSLAVPLITFYGAYASNVKVDIAHYDTIDRKHVVHGDSDTQAREGWEWQPYFFCPYVSIRA
jgi:hypothetical protein